MEENCLYSLRSVASTIWKWEGMAVDVVHPRCCGLDVHKKTIVACVLISEGDGLLNRQLRTFGTMTTDLLALGD